MRVGVVYWQKDDGIISLISTALQAVGHTVIDLLPGDDLSQNLDLIWVYGPFGSLVPFVRPLLALPPGRRPRLIFSHSEQLPNPSLPEWLRYTAGVTRSRLERLAYAQSAPGTWELRPRLRWLTTRGLRFRYYGDLLWLRQSGLLTVLAFPSPWTSSFLRARGFDVVTTNGALGTGMDWGSDLKLERDIPILWLGKPGSKRRARLLAQIRAELQARGVEMMVVDGIEHPYVFGEERTVLLNRAQIVLNIIRAPWDDNAMRYYLAAPNRALIVTEPMLPHTPFVPGVHLVESPIDTMTDTLCYYLEHEDERARIVEQAYQLVSGMSLEKNIRQLLDAAVSKAEAVSEH
jgi:hypothetical protein